MRKHRCLFLVLLGFILTLKTFANEVKEKTDSSFVGDNPQKPINSSFIGDISKSKVNYFFADDVKKYTDNEFVGDNTIKTDYRSYFAGSSYQQQVGKSTVTAFAEDHSPTSKDGIFIGEDVKKKTDDSFVGIDPRKSKQGIY